MLKIKVESAEQTQAIAKKMGPLLQARDILLLDGDLGAGKTTFTKGLAEYQQGRLPLYHMDVYRLEETGGDDLGLEEYFEGDGVSVVEWSQFVGDEIPADKLIIHLKKDDDNDDVRYLEFEPHGKRYEELVSELEKEGVTKR